MAAKEVHRHDDACSRIPGAGRWGGAKFTAGSARNRHLPALHQPAPLSVDELGTLRGWLVGAAALRPEAARRLLERAVERGQLLDEPALHWRAVKAHLAGDANWAEMGFKLIFD